MPGDEGEEERRGLEERGLKRVRGRQGERRRQDDGGKAEGLEGK